MNYVYIDRQGEYRITDKFPVGYTVVYHDESYEKCVFACKLKVQVQNDIDSLKQEILQEKKEAIRMMASNIYGHLHEGEFKSQSFKDRLAAQSVEIALAIWQEVEKQVT